jgi:hypothetical protein
MLSLSKIKKLIYATANKNIYLQLTLFFKIVKLAIFLFFF